jgi:hypothetical protein
MCRLSKLWGVVCWLATAGALLSAAAIDPAHAALANYGGTWQVTRKNAPAGSKPEELKNQCTSIGKYFACQQSVNGSITGLLIVVPTAQPGHFNTQNVLPEGRASGKGELVISGDHWVFSNVWNQGTKTTRYRTTDVFSNNNNHIHFEQEESADGVHWQATDSGDNVRKSR